MSVSARVATAWPELPAGVDEVRVRASRPDAQVHAYSPRRLV